MSALGCLELTLYYRKKETSRTLKMLLLSLNLNDVVYMKHKKVKTEQQIVQCQSNLIGVYTISPDLSETLGS